MKNESPKSKEDTLLPASFSLTDDPDAPEIEDSGQSPDRPGVSDIEQSPDRSGILRELAESLDMYYPKSLSDAVRSNAESIKWRARETVQIGIYVAYIKEHAEHGLYLSTLKDQGISSQRASEFLSVLRMLGKFPVPKRRELLGLGKTKMIALAKFEPETIEEMAESGELDEFAALSKREVIDKLRLKEQELKDKDNELWEEQQKKKPRPKNRWPEKVLHIREEAAVTSMNIGHLADQLQLLVNDLGGSELHSSLSKKDLQGQTEYGAAAQAVYLAAVESYRRLKDAVMAYENSGHPVFSIERPEEIAQLDEAELTNVQTLHGLFVEEFKRDTNERRIKRTNKAREGKRGRKLGSGKKK